jgi:hypothetical protein
MAASVDGIPRAVLTRAFQILILMLSIPKRSVGIKDWVLTDEILQAYE